MPFFNHSANCGVLSCVIMLLYTLAIPTNKGAHGMALFVEILFGPTSTWLECSIIAKDDDDLYWLSHTQ
jgi:hypothetical protein